MLTALLLVLTVTACGGEAKQLALPPAPSISAVPEDLGIEVSGLPDGVELEVTDTSVGVEEGANLDFVSPVFTLEPAEQLDAPVTVTVELDNAIPTTTPLLVATRPAADQPWVFQRGQLSADQGHVEYTTTKLDQVGVLSLALDVALESFQTDIRAGLTAGINAKIKAPECELRKEARELGYSVTSTKSTALHWCFGLEGEKRVVKVTNRLLTPVEIAHPQVEALDIPAVPAAYSLWTPILGTTSTFLAPGRTATYDADLEPVTGLILSSDVNATVQSLRLLRATSRAVALRLTSFGVGPANAQVLYKTLLAMPQCKNSLGKGSDALLAGCFSQGKMNRLFGSRALLLAPLLTAPTFPNFLREQAQAMTAAQPSQQQRIDVKRAAPDFSTLIGFWTGRTRALAITGEGLVTETVNNGCCEQVITLTYQLTDPIAKGEVTTAQAKITKVKVSNRKLLKGQVPRVGTEGTLTMNKGVVRPPFLNTTYCNPARAKKGGCGL